MKYCYENPKRRKHLEQVERKDYPQRNKRFKVDFSPVTVNYRKQ